MKKLIIIILLIVGCKSKPGNIVVLTVGYQIDYHPKDKSKTGIYIYYTKYAQGINLNYDTAMQYNDTVVIKYDGKEPMKFVRKIAGWQQIK